MITGIVTGLVVAFVSGHWYFAMFSIVTGVVSGASWIVRIVRHRRRSSAWNATIEKLDAQFLEDCRRCARELADVRRSLHPSMKDIQMEIRMGGRWFWQSRRLDQVSIGHGRRGISVVDGAPTVVIDDIPILLNVAAGELIGIHGRRTASAVRALIVRMAARVGPSDWKLVVLGDADGGWQALRRLPHFVSGSMSDLISEQVLSGRHHLVLLVFDARLLQRHSPVMRAFERASTTVIVVADELHELPAACTAIIDSEGEEIGGIDRSTFEVSCESISLWSDPDLDGAGLVASADFVDLLEDPSPDIDLVAETWQRRSGLGPRVDLGIGSVGPVHLDLDRDGPHGVIVGTTGSGKSEVLRQFVVSMAWNNSPVDISFVLIDYKGGAAFDACADLPHVVGVITDLDEGMATRVLYGLEAELKRREAMLRAARVSDIREFHQGRNEAIASASSTLPRLVVMIDELAALREESPAFVPALAAIAQRGRSLGLHLIVASQRSAALMADVTANASLRIALRVQTSGDSVDVIGSDEAVHLDRNRPGRLLVKVGSDVPQEVQAAAVSGNLRELCALVTRAFERQGLSKPDRPWLDALPGKIVAPPGDSTGIVGMVDDLVHQRQHPYRYRVDQHTMIVAGVGRSNALRVLARSLGNVSNDVDVVIVTSRQSRSDGLSQFGCVIDVSDRERLARALHLCRSRIDSSSSITLSSADTSPGRRVVLMIDDVDIWYSQLSADRVGAHLWEYFERIMAMGSTSQFSCVMTSSQDRFVPSSISSRTVSMWTGGDRAGIFRIRSRTSDESTEVQLFWEDPELQDTGYSNDELERDVSALPSVVAGPPGSWAMVADTREFVSVGANMCGSGEAFRFLVIGSSGSGVTMTVSALVRSWSAAHPTGRIVDLTTMRDGVEGPAQSLPNWIVSLSCDEAALVVADDVHRHSSGTADVFRIVDDPNRWGHISIVVGTTPVFVRSRPEHWVQQIRRTRSGILLGRSVDEDGDLLGLHGVQVNVYPSRPGRGLWVNGGSSMGIVHVVSSSIV